MTRKREKQTKGKRVGFSMSSLLLPMMDGEDDDNPFDLSSSQRPQAANWFIDSEECTEHPVPCLDRKRKLNAEQLGLPIPKHKCWDHYQLHPEPSGTGADNRQVEDIITHVLNENLQGNSIDNRMSDGESADDSNSFVVDSHSCTTSVSSEAKEVTKTWPSSLASASYLNWLSDKDHQCSSKGNELSLVCYDKFQAYDHHENGLLEYGNHFGYPYQEYYYKDGGDEEVDNVLGLNASNAHVYVLSSGRWSVDQDPPQPGARKPTIDQEFEQYFSSLML